MKFNVEMNGVPVPVDFDDNFITDIKKQVMDEIKAEIEKKFALDIVEAYARQCKYPELEEHEIEAMKEVCPFPEYQTREDFIDSVVTGSLRDIIYSEADRFLANRPKYYRVTMRATQEFDIYVKATDEAEAEEYAGSLDYDQLSDYINPYDAEYEVVSVDGNGTETCPNGDGYYDATEV